MTTSIRRRSSNPFSADAKRLDPRSLQQYLYGFEGREAIRHLFRVAASLDSMVSASRRSWASSSPPIPCAKESGRRQRLLDTVMTRAFGVAKRVRTETDIGVSAVSVSYAAVELAREIFGIAQEPARDADRRGQNVGTCGAASAPIRRAADSA